MNRKVDGMLSELLIYSNDKFRVRKIVEDLEKELIEIEKVKNNAYRERNELVALISKLFPAYKTRHPEDEEWEDDWRWIIVIDLPTGQVSWHIHDDEISLFSHLQEGVNSWDGHDNKEKYKRIRRFKP